MENLKDTEEVELLLCVRCYDAVNDSEHFATEDGIVCDKCYNDYHPCHTCDKIYQSDDLSQIDGNAYCDDCKSDLDWCEHCEEYGEDMDLTRVNTRSGEECWCHGCVNNNSWCCHQCNEYYSDYYDSVYVRSIGNMCEDCRDHVGTFECSNCEDTWRMDDCSNSDDDCDYWLCNRCQNSGGGRIMGYNYKPRPTFFKADGEHLNEKDDLYFGIELEVEQNESDTNKGAMAKEIEHPSYYFKNDGSLSNGFEIVTHPMTIAYIHQHKEDVFKKMLNALISNRYRSYDSDTCGMHIHLSKKSFGTWQLYRFIKFFIDNKEFVTAISQRKIDNLNRWATIEEETTDEVIYKAKRKSGNNKRYVAVNLQNDKTIELRLFRGTLNYLSFMKNIEFCYALFNFTRDCKDITLESFKEYISKSSEYNMLNKFIKTKNL